MRVVGGGCKRSWLQNLVEREVLLPMGEKGLDFYACKFRMHPVAMRESCASVQACLFLLN